MHSAAPQNRLIEPAVRDEVKMFSKQALRELIANALVHQDFLASGAYVRIKPGVHRCSSIKAAEACKVIENTQLDLNIALMNELAIIFDKMNIDTAEVLQAAGTKWNFLKFSPGLVGGHFIPVADFRKKLIRGGCFVDVKACFDAKAFEDVGIKVWRL